MKLSNSNIKKFLTLIFSETEFPKKKNSYFLGNGTLLYFGKQTPLKNFLYFRKPNFPSPKNKKKLYFKCLLYCGKWNCLAPNFTNFLYFKMENEKFAKQTKKPAQSSLL